MIRDGISIISLTGWYDTAVRTTSISVSFVFLHRDAFLLLVQAVFLPQAGFQERASSSAIYQVDIFPGYFLFSLSAAGLCSRFQVRGMFECACSVFWRFHDYSGYRLLMSYLVVASVSSRDTHVITHSVSTLPGE